MSEQQVEATQSNAAEAGAGNESSGTTATAGDGFKAITSQEELNAAIADRIARERAKFKDYGDLKAKASKLDELEEAQKTELQKIQERAEAAEKRAADLEAAEQKRQADAEAAKQIADWKADVSKKTGVPADVLRGSDLAEIQAHADSLKALLPEPRKPGYVSGEGRTVAAGGSNPAADFAAALKQAGIPG